MGIDRRRQGRSRMESGVARRSGRTGTRRHRSRPWLRVRTGVAASSWSWSVACTVRCSRRIHWHTAPRRCGPSGRRSAGTRGDRRPSCILRRTPWPARRHRVHTWRAAGHRHRGRRHRTSAAGKGEGTPRGSRCDPSGTRSSPNGKSSCIRGDTSGRTWGHRDGTLPCTRAWQPGSSGRRPWCPPCNRPGSPGPTPRPPR